MPSAAENYAAMLDAVDEQQLRLFGPRPADIWTGQSAAQFRFDPRRDLDPNLAALESYVTPDDVLVDVGGGAGRISLPFALRCREVLTVEPSEGMAAEYEGSRQGAGIANSRLVPANWMEEHGIEGDVTLTCDVTYFVRDIAPFVEKMHSSARRRVMILVWSEPPPNRGAHLFRRVYGEPLAPMPGHRELLPVRGMWVFCRTSVCCLTLPGGRTGTTPRGRMRWPRLYSAAGPGRASATRPFGFSMSSSTNCLFVTRVATGPSGESRCGSC